MTSFDKNKTNSRLFYPVSINRPASSTCRPQYDKPFDSILYQEKVAAALNNERMNWLARKREERNNVDSESLQIDKRNNPLGAHGDFCALRNSIPDELFRETAVYGPAYGRQQERNEKAQTLLCSNDDQEGSANAFLAFAEKKLAQTLQENTRHRNSHRRSRLLEKSVDWRTNKCSRTRKDMDFLDKLDNVVINREEEEKVQYPRPMPLFIGPRCKLTNYTMAGEAAARKELLQQQLPVRDQLKQMLILLEPSDLVAASPTLDLTVLVPRVIDLVQFHERSNLDALKPDTRDTLSSAHHLGPKKNARSTSLPLLSYARRQFNWKLGVINKFTQKCQRPVASAGKASKEENKEATEKCLNNRCVGA